MDLRIPGRGSTVWKWLHGLAAQAQLWQPDQQALREGEIADGRAYRARLRIAETENHVCGVASAEACLRGREHSGAEPENIYFGRPSTRGLRTNTETAGQPRGLSGAGVFLGTGT